MEEYQGTVVKFWRIKDEIRIIGFDDAPFIKRRGEKTIIVGVVFRGASVIDGVLTSEITVDGDDFNSRIIYLINSSRQKGQLRVIMLNGITFGGFNVADIQEIYRHTGIPVIVVVRRKPDIELIKKALKKAGQYKSRYKRILRAGKSFPVYIRNNKAIFIQIAGIELENAEAIVRLTAVRSHIPEPLRVAHIIASGIVLGASHGSA